MQVSKSGRVQDDAEAFLSAWFETRRVIQSMNFNRFAQEGLSATQFIVLNMLGDAATESGTSAANLARRLNVDVTTSMRTAETLVSRGLVRKRKDPLDGRRSLLTLTAAGRKVHGRMHRAFIERVTAAFVSMPAASRRALIAGLDAFVAASAQTEG